MKKIASIIIIVILNLLFYKNVFDEWYIICLVTFITSTITLLILTVILYYLERKIGLSKLQKINKDDPNKFTYYRDLLNECTIGEIGYLYNKNRRTKLVISSEIELLKQRGKIVIENDNIKIINKDNCKGTEKYILDHYIFLETKEFKKGYLKKAKETLKKKEFLKYPKIQSNDLFTFVYVLLYFLCFIGLFAVIFTGGEVSNQTAIKIIAVASFFIMFLTCMIFMLLQNPEFKDYTLIETDKGKEIIEKLNGLKRFLRDFGNFDDKELQEIYLWDEYIPYAIILNESNKLEKEALNEFNNIMRFISKI